VPAGIKASGVRIQRSAVTGELDVDKGPDTSAIKPPERSISQYEN